MFYLGIIQGDSYHYVKVHQDLDQFLNSHNNPHQVLNAQRVQLLIGLGDLKDIPVTSFAEGWDIVSRYQCDPSVLVKTPESVAIFDIPTPAIVSDPEAILIHLEDKVIRLEDYPTRQKQNRDLLKRFSSGVFVTKDNLEDFISYLDLLEGNYWGNLSIRLLYDGGYDITKINEDVMDVDTLTSLLREVVVHQPSIFPLLCTSKEGRDIGYDGPERTMDVTLVSNQCFKFANNLEK